MSTILIVEDDQNTRLGLQELLVEEGYQVESAENGSAALQKLKSGLVDLLISDLRLSDTSGLDLCRKIKIDYPNLNTIIMSAYSTPESRLEAKELGVYSWFTKPLELDSLLSAIKKAL
ncbi:response regulator [bacterium]|nr:response regulator [bacterium]